MCQRERLSQGYGDIFPPMRLDPSWPWRILCPRFPEQPPWGVSSAGTRVQWAMMRRRTAATRRTSLLRWGDDAPASQASTHDARLHRRASSLRRPAMLAWIPWWSWCIACARRWCDSKGDGRGGSSSSGGGSSSRRPSCSRWGCERTRGRRKTWGVVEVGSMGVGMHGAASAPHLRRTRRQVV
jgi:hypothetical protein